MTYWLYHLIFTLPLLALLFWHLRNCLTRSHLVCMAVAAAIAFVFTTPWDNYAVWLGIWAFGDGVSLGYPFNHLSSRLSWLGHIPFEEYSYFIIETLLACLVVTFFIERQRGRNVSARSAPADESS